MQVTTTANFSKYKKGILELRESAFDKSNDTDIFDDYYDHIVVLNEQEKVVGAYRICVANNEKKLLSDPYFDITYLKQADKKGAELGRAAVHPDYRDGSVILLLWTEIAKYMVVHDLTYLFGMSSYTNQNIEERKFVASNILAYLKDKQAISTLPITPKNEYIPLDMDFEREKYDKKLIPPLFKGYVRIKAKFIPIPILDIEYNPPSIDFFTIFHKEQIAKKYLKLFR